MKIPYLATGYVNVYSPAPAVYEGPDSRYFRRGALYEKWVPNDFTIVKCNGKWHMLGITHPCPPEFVDKGSVVDNIHDAEWQLFHAVSEGDTFKQSLRPGGFRQERHVLNPFERPGERNEIWAPICWRVGDEYVLLYSPDPFRTAASRDLYQWTCEGEALRVNEPSARDPNIMEYEGEYYAVFLSGNSLCVAKSRDMRHYDAPVSVFTGTPGISMESPILKRIGDYFYLFYCIYDSRDRINGYYDYRTFVHAARDIRSLAGTRPIAELNAHAPELVVDEDGDHYLLSVEWPYRGVSAARLMWK